MKCPVCTDTTLLMSDRQGVEIDHCPRCRGVWLDRGELDKLIERSAALAVANGRGWTASSIEPPCSSPPGSLVVRSPVREAPHATAP